MKRFCSISSFSPISALSVPTAPRDVIYFLRSGSIDFSLTLRRINEQDLYSECLIDEPVVILVSKDSHLASLPSINISQPDGETLTIYQNAESLKLLFLEFFSKAGAVPSRILQLYDPVLQVLQNIGFIFMPQARFLTYSKKRSLSQLCQFYFSHLREYHAISVRECCLPELSRFQVTQPYRLEKI